ncbi:MAG: uracil-DNA glycosylase [Olsenella sp.]|nr:uracil-DNA glycosylase [Olsenella sp.]
MVTEDPRAPHPIGPRVQGERRGVALAERDSGGCLPEWLSILSEETVSLMEHIETLPELAEGMAFYPPREDVYNALRETSPHDARVVIIGQDPYHEPGQAMGLAFSVREGVRLPPSLRNILKELESDIGHHAASGDLTPWARQGVLLLNTVLTVPPHKANGHAKLGWQSITSQVLDAIFRLGRPVVVLAWGKQAVSTIESVPSHGLPNVRVLASTHPSPLSANRSTADLPAFIGSRPFSRANDALAAAGCEPIDWSVV